MRIIQTLPPPVTLDSARSNARAKESAQTPPSQGADADVVSIRHSGATSVSAEASSAQDARVREIRARVQDGSYKVDLAKLADRLLSNEMARAGLK
jgi:flagellar biosynthesis anti-sigma factor FlgM